MGRGHHFWDRLERPTRRLNAVCLRGHPGELAFEAGRGADEQVPRRLVPAVGQSVRGTAGGEGELSGCSGEERVVDAEDELAFEEVERLVEVVAVQWRSRAERGNDDLDGGDVAARFLAAHAPTAARQLASRARRRIQGTIPNDSHSADAARRHTVVKAFLTAAREGDFIGLLAVLDPDVVLRADANVPALGGLHQLSGREAVAHVFLGKAQAARAALLDAAVGAVFMPDGQLRGALEFVVSCDRITAIEIVSDPGVLAALDVVPLKT